MRAGKTNTAPASDAPKVTGTSRDPAYPDLSASDRFSNPSTTQSLELRRGLDASDRRAPYNEKCCDDSQHNAYSVASCLYAARYRSTRDGAITLSRNFLQRLHQPFQYATKLLLENVFLLVLL